MREIIERLDAERPVLIAGPTGSGKSALAMEVAARTGGVVVNADALQVFSDWRLLTARPSPEDEARVLHALYGHVAGDIDYSVGAWLRDVTPFLGHRRPVIVGGTGLYFMALTEGLADIPPVPQEVRQAARDRPAEVLLAEIDAATAARIDCANPARVRRAWEVLQATGRGLAEWQDRPTPAILPLADTQALLVECPPERLTPRLAARIDKMLTDGAVDEAQANRPGWNPARPSAKAIGAAELMAHLDGRLPLEEVRERMVVATRQFAKRQRTWFRARMRGWTPISLP
ncbi:tRNA (adenosine(37)-N6)-dimethylallyltransferase MiaA [Roseitranquillus sediminis]|uniref:tRNA (adenosine(37)-N6)-dimethylallyltransferase MiaA n=1 Tax=Roseitranquillus sediminis TaxID=2809051 RepID=UPI001D0C130F|nr:tRNA (adenosine(37)-N6)-dimethylallyltransferase MiaA [Roseitranquillus sediminis]MBM9595644.1 tRNA (adenosine(37)-N6)-dimethylallyltransferase MiaA [Roseitranquillus sediminis]